MKSAVCPSHGSMRESRGNKSLCFLLNEWHKRFVETSQKYKESISVSSSVVCPNMKQMFRMSRAEVYVRINMYSLHGYGMDSIVGNQSLFFCLNLQPLGNKRSPGFKSM